MTRRRPQFHFTPARGWMNDPHGIVFDGERYHLFFQYSPLGTSWEAAMHWGHAVSPDLVQWQELEPALMPCADEVGCWSGSVVLAPQPTMFYTRPTAGEWSRGLVVAATGSADLGQWTRSGVVIDGPPSDEFFDFRDPQVRGDGQGWKLTIGAGQRGVGGCALQYSSTDLRHWSYDGVLASRSSEAGPLASGTVWECPQFLQVDGQWVLLVSAMDQAGLAEVLYAIGDYDGLAFTPRTWGHFGHSKSVYATTTFHDAEGQPCVMSWLRELPVDEGQPWAGEQSFVQRLHVIDDRLVLEQHPNLDPIVTAAEPAWRFTINLEEACNGGFCIDIDDADSGWSLVLDWDAHTLHVSADDAVTYVADLRSDGATGQLDVVVDAGIAEVTWSGGEGMYAFMVPDVDPERIDVTTW